MGGIRRPAGAKVKMAKGKITAIWMVLGAIILSYGISKENIAELILGAFVFVINALGYYYDWESK